ncbi:MAG TPA: hypothetical protein VFW28_12310 [Micropepsaceae bacterium]|nr:hypothetical protein [Micropepsaceae bacterium]
MRVITTWMYFDRSQITAEPNFGRRPRGRGEEPEPGIGIGWFVGDTTNLMSPIHNLKVFHSLRGQEKEEALSAENLRNYVDLFLMDVEEFEFDRSVGRMIVNRDVVEYVLSEPFVIERSPPVHMTLKGLLTTTNLPIWIGTYMGWSVVPDHSVLLFITIPGGIVVVSSATGLALALSAGLSKSVKRLFRG